MIVEGSPIISEAWGWVYGIQPVVWASMIAFGGASITVIVTAWTASRHRKEADRLATLQRQHDSDQRDRDRTMAIRKEIFLAGAQGVSLAISTIGAMGNLDNSDKKLSMDALEVNGAISKMLVIGDASTVKAVQAFSVTFAAAFLQLLLDRAEASAEDGRAGGGDQGKTTVFDLRLDLANKAAKQGDRLLRDLPGLLFAARRELGITTDEAEFLSMQAAGTAEVNEIRNRFLDALDSLRDRPRSI